MVYKLLVLAPYMPNTLKGAKMAPYFSYNDINDGYHLQYRIKEWASGTVGQEPRPAGGMGGGVSKK